MRRDKDKEMGRDWGRGRVDNEVDGEEERRIGAPVMEGPGCHARRVLFYLVGHWQVFGGKIKSDLHLEKIIPVTLRGQIK